MRKIYLNSIVLSALRKYKNLYYKPQSIENRTKLRQKTEAGEIAWR